MERMDRLWPEGPVFYYDDALFPPGTDAFLLGDFARPKPGQAVCDLGAGTGLIGLLLLSRVPSLSLHCVELSHPALRLAEKTYAANRLDASCHLADLRALEGVLPAGGFHLVVSNPPYFPVGGGPAAAGSARRNARSETACTIRDLCRAAARLLRWGGALAVVYRPERLVDLMEAMRQSGLEPKRLRLVQHAPGHTPSLVLVEGRRGGKPGLRVEPLLFLHHTDGTDTSELRRIYFRDVSLRKEP